MVTHILTVNSPKLAADRKIVWTIIMSETKRRIESGHFTVVSQYYIWYLVLRNWKMSKSDLGHELLRDQSVTDENLSTQRSSEVVTTGRDRETVTPIAKEMVENVVTGALSILDVSRKEGKPWKVVLAANKNHSDVAEEKNPTADSVLSADSLQLPAVQAVDIICDSVHAEQVARIVKGLQDIQIGDSAFVLPANGSNIEKQVKRAVRNINNLEFGDMETAQLIICDGQGDVDAVILEAEVGPPSSASSKPQHDASKVSTCYLHKMIEELEDSDSTKRNSPNRSNKEGIASWEESQEQFLRIIEGPGDERGSTLVQDEEPVAAILDESPPLGEGTDDQVQNMNAEDLFDQISQQGFDEDDFIRKRESGSRPRDLLDHNSDGESYWCTAGLITGVVNPQHSGVIASKTTMVKEESRNLGTEGNPKARQTDNPQETVDKDVELNGKKKKSFGKRLRNFFSRFTRSKRC